MAQAKHVCTELIDQAALNAAELMTKTTNVILHPATGSVFLFAFQEALALGSLTGMRLIWDHYNAAASASLSPSLPLRLRPPPRCLGSNTFSDVDRCQITPQLASAGLLA